ncbi:sensor histidine kinase [Paenibacillus sp. Soil787]|uniref:sensor histidine kinase n=1 Tax=Paenibacillus sp. Soil787 TaxID=1736411 RepID=UPI0006F4634E|nr:histidine kinase [Paenibacillus sp. Soil787]KRF43668.1 hypothetical protein ASG93_01745 [Paenibacillus sp. Soil787]
MKWLMRFSFYRKTQLSFAIFILLPLTFVTLVSYTLVKSMVIDKVHDTNQSVVNVISSDLNKNVEDIIYASYVFSNKDSSFYNDLFSFKDVQKLSSSKDYFTTKRISEYLDIAFSKTSGLNAQVFYVNKSNFVSYATNNSLDYTDLTRWLSQINLSKLNNNMSASPVQWLKGERIKQMYTPEAESFYFAVKVIRNADNGEMIGTLYVGIPSEYFEHTFARSGSGQFQLYTSEGELIYSYPKENSLLDRKYELEVQSTIPRARWKLVYQFSSKEITSEISKVFSFYAIILSLCILAFIIISFFIAKTLHTPLNKLRKTADQFGSGDRLIRFPVSGTDEVAVLGKSFNEMLDQINLLITEVEQEQEEKRIIELDALFSQIQPHFLLNTLNSIKCNLITEGDSANSRQINALMSLLRAYMRVNEKCYLKQECKLLEDYVEIMQMRNNMRIGLHISLEVEMEDIDIPRLLLQPLVENAILHGFYEIPDDAAIWVNVKKVSEKCLIEVKDNGTGMTKLEMDQLQIRVLQSRVEPEASNRSIGLANVYNRLRLTYGVEVKMGISSNEFGGVSINLQFPIR